MSGPGRPEVRRADSSLPRRVLGSLRWVLSPLDYRMHVLVEGDQPGGVVAARCGAVLPVVFPVHDQPCGRPCPPCEVILRAGTSGGFARKPPR